MGFADPFAGYTMLLRLIVFGAVPAFALLQVFRLRLALHVFQLEGYRASRFASWCRTSLRRRLLLEGASGKRPLVMTGRAWRLLIASVALSVIAVLAVPAGAHLLGGWPYDVTGWALATVAVFFWTDRVLLLSDRLLAPVQRAVNAHYRRAAEARLNEIAPVVVGVTGSFGKTSTKFAVAGLLGDAGEVLATPSSFNTPLGVCRAINEQLAASHRYFVVEMGAYGRGEIRELCHLVRPRIGVLTSIGPAHLERFGSLEAIRRAKYELVESLPRDGAAVMNTDDEEVRALADATSHVDVIRYGQLAEGQPDVTAEHVVVTASGTRLDIVDLRSGEGVTSETRLLGSHSVGHVLAAVSVALACGRALADIGDAIAGLRPVEHRLEIIEGTGGVTVIDDAYNANPRGALVALEVLEAMPGRRKVVVTPGMIELGELQFEANRRFGEQIGRVADALIVVAPVNREAIVQGAHAGDETIEVTAVDSLALAQERLRTLLLPGDVVLFENDLPGHLES